MTVYILVFIFHVIIYRPQVCNKHLNIVKVNTSTTYKGLNTYIFPLNKYHLRLSHSLYRWELPFVGYL